jgi:hypothetical protein
LVDRVLADLVLLSHLAFVLFAIFGGLLVMRFRMLIWLHLPALAWGIWIEISGNICPLTAIENRLRDAGGSAGYRGGFIDHYVTATLYPDGLSRNIQFLLAALLAIINVAVYSTLAWRSRRRVTRT